MKSSFLSSLFFVLSATFLIACSSSDSISLKGPDANPGKGSEQGGDTKPTPTPSASPTPAPGQPGNGQQPAPNPTATPQPPATYSSVARIYCETGATSGTNLSQLTLNTLRADVVTNFTMSGVDFYNSANKHVTGVKSPLPLTSNGETSSLLLYAQEDMMAPWKIYKSTVDLLGFRGDLKVVSNFEGLPLSAQYAYDTLKISGSVMAANSKRNGYVYPNDQGVYVFESKTGKVSLNINAQTSFSPVFVGNDEYLRVDQTTSPSILTQKLYSIKAGKLISLPAPMDSKDYQLFSFVNSQKNVFWVEGRPGSTWRLRFASLSNPSKGTTLVTLSGSAANTVLPFVIFESGGQTQLAYIEEVLAPGAKSDSNVKGSLHLMKVDSKNLKLLDNKNVPYTGELTDLASSAGASDKNLVHSLFYESLSGKLYGSVSLAGGLGGLFSYDLKTDSWGLHAIAFSTNTCLNPASGIEVTRD